ncbi:MAG: efflux RND transporter periplasmic adaptor subunit, partial [Gallionellales bacterium CG_4_9_14_0_8_um_filter_59_50]
GSRQGISVPQAALLERAGIAGVFVVDADAIARYRMVRTGGEQEGVVEIEAGLNPGERVIVGNTRAVNSGDRINLTGSSQP